MPNETKTAATKTKATKIHDPMLTLQRAVAYIVLFVLCFVCLFFFYVLIVNATHNNFTIQQGFDPLPRTSFGTNFYNTTHDANVPILSGLRNSLIVSAACAALSVYFSALTAYAIYAYDFKLRKLAFHRHPAYHDDADAGVGAGLPELDGQDEADQHPVAADPAQHCRAHRVLLHEAEYVQLQPAAGYSRSAARIDGSGEFHDRSTRSSCRSSSPPWRCRPSSALWARGTTTLSRR